MPDSLTTWMPADIESALLSEGGPCYRENFEWAKHEWPMDEVHPHEAWRFVIDCTNELVGGPSSSWMPIRSTPSGADDFIYTQARWNKAVGRTIQNYPDWFPAD